MNKKLQAILASPVTWIALLSLVWIVVFALDLAPILRGGFGWEWNYKPVLQRFRILPLILGIPLYIGAGLWLRRRERAWPLLVWACAGGIGLTLAAAHVRGDVLYRLYSLTVSGRASGWHMAAARIADLAGSLQNWPQFMLQSVDFSPHVRLSPPGLVLVYYTASHALDAMPQLASGLAQPFRWLLCQYLPAYSDGEFAAAWLGVLMPVWSSLTVLPLYALGRDAFGPETARWSVLWWPLLPTFLMFAPLPYTFFALPAALIIWTLWKGLQTGRMQWVLASGGLMSLLTFLTFAVVPLLLFAGLFTLGIFWKRAAAAPATRLTWHWPIRIGLWFLAGLSSVWLLYYVVARTGVWAMWTVAQQEQLALDRSYLPWLGLHLNDLFMFTGWPLSLLAMAGLWAIVRKARAPRNLSEGDVMLMAAALTLIVLDLSGTLRGEAGRILLFMCPWLLLAGGDFLARGRRGGSVVTALQGAAAIVMILCLQVLAPEFRAHAAPVVPDAKLPALTPETYPADVVFGGKIRLTSAAGRIENQIAEDGSQKSTVFLWLTWDTLSTMQNSYAYQAEVVAANGAPLSDPAVISPFGSDYPMTCWRSAQGPVIDRITVPLRQPATGPVWVQLAIVDPSSSQQLSPAGNGPSSSATVKLGPFQ